jgi:hypothetical protein
MKKWCHNTQYNDNQQNGTHHNNKNVTLSITSLDVVCSYDECHIFIVMVSAVMLIVVILSVMAPIFLCYNYSEKLSSKTGKAGNPS